MSLELMLQNLGITVPMAARGETKEGKRIDIAELARALTQKFE
jgi:hypothetical protein